MTHHEKLRLFAPEITPHTNGEVLIATTEQTAPAEDLTPAGVHPDRINANRKLEGHAIDSERTQKRLHWLAQELNVGAITLVQQQHGDKVVKRTRNNLDEIFDADAQITDNPEVSLGVYTADCAPILLWNEDLGVRAAIHSGWRGTVNNIVDSTIAKLERAYGVMGEDLLAYIGPLAQADCYVVGEDFHIKDSPHLLPGDQKADPGDEAAKRRFDNQAAVKEQLIESGVPADAIAVDGRCTIEDPSLHSARREGTAFGHNLTVIGVPQST